MDTLWEIRMDKVREEMEEAHIGRREYCKTCADHNENCPYYDPNEESWDCEQCFRATEE